jgi:hypothetical protein
MEFFSPDEKNANRPRLAGGGNPCRLDRRTYGILFEAGRHVKFLRLIKRLSTSKAENQTRIARPTPGKERAPKPQRIAMYWRTGNGGRSRTSCPTGMCTVSPEPMNCSRQDTASRRPGRRCLSATAFSKLIRRPGRPTTFHATGAQTLPPSLSPSSPPGLPRC